MEILVIKKKIAAIKRSMAAFNRRLNTIEDRNREFEDKTVGNIHFETQRKNVKYKKENTRHLEYSKDV